MMRKWKTYCLHR